MGMEFSPIPPAEVLAIFERQEPPGEPLTAPEIADAMGCARRTAHDKLTQLADAGALETKKIGARGRVWWQSTRTDAESTATGTTDHPDDGEQRLERRARERALRELHVASRRLMRAETHQAIAEIAVSAGQRILGLSLSGLWLYAPDREALEPMAWTESGVEEYGEPPVFPIGESLVGEAFRAGSFRVYDDVTAEEAVYDAETRVRSELILPLGGHGVLNASSPDVGVFDEFDVSLGRILAANVQTALERADRLEERRERRRALERQRDELETLNQINALIEETIGALVEAATREELERTVCERLAGADFYVDAWVVERGSAPGELHLRTQARDQDDWVESIAGADEPRSDTHPIASALENRRVEVVSRLDEDGGVLAPDRTAATTMGTRACLVAPLAYAETVFGALVVHAPDPDPFSEREVTAFETLGRVIGFVINATNNRQLLLGNTAVEIEVSLHGTDAWFLAAAEKLGGTVTIDGLVPTEDGNLIEYVTVEGATADTVPEDVIDLPAVTDLRVLGAGDDHWDLECSVRTESGGLREIVEYGATVRRARARGRTGRITTRFPATASPREAVTVIHEAYPPAELVAKRVVDISDQSVSTTRQTVDERLTDKQLLALRAAYHAGYYDSPRGTTAQELAASLSIAPSTLHQHLQAAQRKVLATVFDDPSTG